MRTRTSLLTAGLLLMTTIAFAANATYDYDRSADFSKFKTYAWVDGTKVNDELSHKRVVAIIDSKLAMKGMKRVEANANPDALVAYHANFARDVEVTASGFGGYRWGGTGSGLARASEVLVGTLTVDIVDAHANSLVWRSATSKDIDVKAGPEKREKNLNKATEELFKNYPPKKK